MARVTIGDVWDRTTEFLGEHWGAVLPVVLGAMVVPSVIATWLAFLAEGGTQTLKIGVAVASFGLALISLWAQLAIAARAIEPGIGGGANRIATARLLPAIGIYLLIGVVVTLIFVVQIIVLAVVAGVDLSQLATRSADQQMTMPPGVGPGILVLFIVEAIAILFLAVRIAPLTGVIVAERRGIGAIGRAWRLTRGLTWKLVGVVILYAVVSWVSSAATTMVVGGLSAVLLGRGTTAAMLVTAVPVGIVSAIFTVLATVFAAKLYLATVRADAPPIDVPA